MNPILLNFPDHFSTERLDLRAPRAGDGSELHAAVCETWDELTPWLPWARKLPTAEECEELMRDAVAKWQRREDLWLLAFVKGTGQLVASSGLSRIAASICARVRGLSRSRNSSADAYSGIPDVCERR